MEIVVSDTSVLLNFLKIQRLDLLENCSHSFLITEHVEVEIADYYPQQCRSLQKAIEQEILQKITLIHPIEMDLFSELSQEKFLGRGESSAIAVAIHRNLSLAIDDVKAIKSARSMAPALPILRTQDLIVAMLQQEILTLPEADAILSTWADKHRFKLKIRSFQELLQGVTE